MLGNMLDAVHLGGTGIETTGRENQQKPKRCAKLSGDQTGEQYDGAASFRCSDTKIAGGIGVASRFAGRSEQLARIGSLPGTHGTDEIQALSAARKSVGIFKKHGGSYNASTAGFLLHRVLFDRGE